MTDLNITNLTYESEGVISGMLDGVKKYIEPENPLWPLVSDRANPLPAPPPPPYDELLREWRANAQIVILHVADKCFADDVWTKAEAAAKKDQMFYTRWRAGFVAVTRNHEGLNAWAVRVFKNDADAWLDALPWSIEKPRDD